MKDAPLVNFALGIFITVAVGWLLLVGRPIILPIVSAIIVVYILVSASNAIHRQPLMQLVPLSVIKISLALIFGATFILFATLAAATAREIASVAPVYEANIDAFLESIAEKYELDHQELWGHLRAVTIDAFDLRVVMRRLLGGFTNVGATVFLIAIYAAFLMLERDSFRSKLQAAFPDEAQANKAADLIIRMNRRIGDYLAAKTLVNILLGLVSFVVLWAHGIDFAVFWAVVTGLLNYIPYVGSYLGVFFPIVLSFAQFVSLPLTLSLTAFLAVTQFVIGSIIDPRFIGRQVNLSPVVVLASLSVWAALWGIPGAILAVPMTSMLCIMLASFESTKFIAVLLSAEVDAAAETDGSGV